MKTLVAYFSAGGTTARVAGEIASAVGGDLFEIRPQTPYSVADLDWTDKHSRSSVEMNDSGCRPPLAESVGDLSAYDTVFIGFPIWWYTEPRIVDTFIDEAHLSRKTVIPFATSGGSGISGAEKRMKTLCPEAHWKPGRLLNGGRATFWAEEAVNPASK